MTTLLDSADSKCCYHKKCLTRHSLYSDPYSKGEINTFLGVIVLGYLACFSHCTNASYKITDNICNDKLVSDLLLFNFTDKNN